MEGPIGTVRMVLVPQRNVPDTAGASGGRPWPTLADKIIQVPLRAGGTGREGEVRIGISQEALQDDLLQLRRSLWIKIGLAGALALGLLILGCSSAAPH